MGNTSMESASIETLQVQDALLRVELRRYPDHLTLSIQDRRTDRRWGPVPLVAVEVHDATVRRCEKHERYQIDNVESIGSEGDSRGQGWHIAISHTGQSVSLSLYVRLVDGELSVTFPPVECYEQKPAHFRVFAIEVLPRLANVGARGWVMTPCGGCTAFQPASKPPLQDAFLVYLEQPRWELCPTLPICAAWDEAGGLGQLMAFGDCDAQCRVWTDGQGRGGVGMAFSLRRNWIDPVDFETRELRIVPLSGSSTADGASPPVVALAKRLRRHVNKTLRKPTLRERADASPELAYLLTAPTFKPFFGMEHNGLLKAGRTNGQATTFHRHMTFNECADWMNQCKQSGIRRLHTQMVGWNARGHDGLYPTRFPIEERLGGEQGFRELIRLGNDELGYHMNVHDNFSMNVPHAPDWDPECLIHDIYGEPLLSGWWAGGLEYQTWGLSLPEHRLEGHLRRMKSLGLRGAYYCDYMMRPLEVNYHPRHGGPRSAHKQGQARIMAACAEVFGSVGTEFGILPAVLAGDSITAGPGARPSQANGPMEQLMDRQLPVYQLALHGLVLMESWYGPSWTNTMTSVLWGQHPRDEWTTRALDHEIPAIDQRRLAAYEPWFDLTIERFGSLMLETIERHEQLDENVHRTTFGNGTQVTADFQEHQLFVNNERVERDPRFL